MTKVEAIEIFEEGIKHYRHQKEKHRGRSEREKDLFRWYEEREKAFEMAIFSLKEDKK